MEGNEGHGDHMMGASALVQDALNQQDVQNNEQLLGSVISSQAGNEHMASINISLPQSLSNSTVIDANQLQSILLALQQPLSVLQSNAPVNVIGQTLQGGSMLDDAADQEHHGHDGQLNVDQGNGSMVTRTIGETSLAPMPGQCMEQLGMHEAAFQEQGGQGQHLSAAQEMIAVEVLSQTAANDHQQQGQTQGLNTVGLIQGQTVQGATMYTVQINGQTIPLATVPLPNSQSSQLNSNANQLGSDSSGITSTVVTTSHLSNSLMSTPDGKQGPSEPASDEKGKYTCELCGKSYVRSWSYYGHMREHASGDKNYKCDVCDRVFNFPSNLKHHMLTHTGEKPYECEHCMKAFTNPSSLRIHVLSHSEDKPFVCEMQDCDKAFNNPSSLRVHQRVHQTSKPFRCEYANCNKAFKTTSELSRHAFRHTGEKPHKCDQCDRAFVRYDDLKRHYFIHTGQKPFKCDQCDFACIQSFDLVKHKFTHGGDKPYKCEHCPKQFTRPARLREHMRLHTGEKPYECEDCGKAFTQHTSLKSHRMTHTGEKPFKCDMCSKSFTAVSDLRSHMNNHTGERPFRCELCCKDFISAKTLKRHAIVHSGTKPFECEECGRRFARASDLKVHLPVHSEEKPYKCDECDKMFTRCSTLKEHYRTHTGDYPFKCDFCSKIFNHRSHLNVHLRIHTGERPFKCGICDKDFARRSSLRSHMRVHCDDDLDKDAAQARKAFLDEDSNDLSDANSMDVHDGHMDIIETEQVIHTYQGSKRKHPEDGEPGTSNSGSGSNSSMQKRLATEEQVMVNAVQAMQMMANLSSAGDEQALQVSDATVTVVNTSGAGSMDPSNQVIITGLRPGQYPIMTSDGAAVVTVNLADLEGSEGQVVETLVQLQSLDSQVASLGVTQQAMEHGTHHLMTHDGLDLSTTDNSNMHLHGNEANVTMETPTTVNVNDLRESSQQQQQDMGLVRRDTDGGDHLPLA